MAVLHLQEISSYLRWNRNGIGMDILPVGMEKPPIESGGAAVSGLQSPKRHPKLWQEAMRHECGTVSD